MKTVLMVAYHFPPVGGLGAAGSQRMLKFSRYLPANGWRPVVLTARENAYESYLTLDDELGAQVPGDLTVIRTRVLRGLTPLLELKSALTRRAGRGSAQSASTEAANDPAPTSPEPRTAYRRLKDAITDLFEIPDEVAGWLLPAVYAGVRAIRRERADAIFATGRPWTTLVIGMALKRLTGRPLVLDFRDPWMTNPFRIEYSALKNRLEGGLERRVLDAADLVVANTEHLRAEFVERLGDEFGEKCVWIPNGFDAEEFSRVRPAPRPPELRDAFLLAHSGFLYGRRDPGSLLEAIELLRDRKSLREGELVCELTGAVELPYDLKERISQRGLESFVRLRGQVTYAESLARIAACDLALLLQPGTMTQIPSKIFEYVGLGKKMLAISPPGSGVAKIVAENDLGAVADAEDVEGIADVLERLYTSWLSSPSSLELNSDVRARFDVRECVGDLAGSMNRLVR